MVLQAYGDVEVCQCVSEIITKKKKRIWNRSSESNGHLSIECDDVCMNRLNELVPGAIGNVWLCHFLIYVRYMLPSLDNTYVHILMSCLHKRNQLNAISSMRAHVIIEKMKWSRNDKMWRVKRTIFFFCISSIHSCDPNAILALLCVGNKRHMPFLFIHINSCIHRLMNIVCRNFR